MLNKIIPYEKFNNIYKLKLGKDEQQLPYVLYTKSNDFLENIFFNILYSLHNENIINHQELIELQNSYRQAYLHYHEPGNINQEKLDFQQHSILLISIYAWHLAKLLEYKNINIKYLLMQAFCSGQLKITKAKNHILANRLIALASFIFTMVKSGQSPFEQKRDTIIYAEKKFYKTLAKMPAEILTIFWTLIKNFKEKNQIKINFSL